MCSADVNEMMNAILTISQITKHDVTNSHRTSLNLVGVACIEQNISVVQDLVFEVCFLGIFRVIEEMMGNV